MTAQASSSGQTLGTASAPAINQPNTQHKSNASKLQVNNIGMWLDF